MKPPHARSMHATSAPRACLGQPDPSRRHANPLGSSLQRARERERERAQPHAIKVGENVHLRAVVTHAD